MAALLVADLPRLKAAVATGDAPTVEPLARDYRARVDADAFVVAGRDGKALASLGRGAGRSSGAAGSEDYRRWRAACWRRLGAYPAGDARRRLSGTLTLGFALDDAFDARLAA